MKSIYKPLLFIAALFATTACNNVDDEGLTPDTPVRIKHLTVNATSDDDETRVVIGELADGKYPVLWENKDERLTLIEYNGSEYKTYNSTDYNTEDGRTATFTFDIEEREGSSFSYNAFSPYSAFNGVDDSCLEFTLPEVQKPCAAGEDGEYKVDPKAMILYSLNKEYEGGRQPEDCITLKFNHLTSYARMTVKGLQLDEGAKVKSIKFTVDDENSDLSGYCLYGGGDYIGSTNSVTLDVESLNITSSDFVVWFSTIPAKIETGFTVEIVSGDNIYTRTLRMAEYENINSLDFEAGNIAKFSVNMTNATVTEKDYSGNYMIVATKSTSDNLWALSGLATGNFLTAVKYTDDVNYTTENPANCKDRDLYWTITKKDGYYAITNDGKYLNVSTSATTNLGTVASESNTTKFNITASDGNTVRIQSQVESLNTRYIARYNDETSGNYDRFGNYATGGNNSGYYFDLYLVPAIVKEVPKITVDTKDLELESDDTDKHTLDVAISDDATSSDVKAYAGETTESEASDWLTANFSDDNTKIEYQATANDAENERTAYIIVTATNDSGDATPAVIKVMQMPKQAGEAVYYEKVTSTNDVTAGQYLIVYETGKRVFDGSLTDLDVTSSYKVVTITDNKILSNSVTDSYSFTLAKSGSKFTIKSASGYYIYRTTNSNGLNTSTNEPASSYANTITINNNGDADIVSSSTYLRYNASGGQDRFRYFSSGTYTNQQAVQLYKKSGSTGETDPTPADPEIQLTNNTLTIEANATSGTVEGVTVTNQTSVDVAVTYNGGNSGWVSNAKYNESANTVTFTATANDTTTERSATLTVTAQGEEGTTPATATITVTQKGKTEQGGGTTEVTDVIDLAFTGVSGSSYNDWSNKKGSNSTAVYSGNTSGNSSTIQMRSTNNSSGIVTTTSGGKVAKIKVEWKTVGSNAGTTLNIYTKDTPYNSPADLYGNNSGTLVGTIVKGTSTEFVINNPTATYLGLRSNSGAINFGKIEITWVSDDTTGGNTGGGSETPVAPTVSVSPESLTWTSDETTAKTVNVTVTGDASEITATSSNTSYFTASYANGKVTVTPTSANTSTDARTATVTVKATNAGVSGEATITVEQSGQTSGGGNEPQEYTATVRISDFGSTSSYQTSLTTATVSGIEYKANNFNNGTNNTGQARMNQTTGNSNFYIYNTTGFDGYIKSVTMETTSGGGTFNDNTIFCLLGTSAITSQTAGTGTVSTLDSTNKKLTWNFDANTTSNFFGIKSSNAKCGSGTVSGVVITITYVK